MTYNIPREFESRFSNTTLVNAMTNLLLELRLLAKGKMPTGIPWQAVAGTASINAYTLSRALASAINENVKPEIPIPMGVLVQENKCQDQSD